MVCNDTPDVGFGEPEGFGGGGIGLHERRAAAEEVEIHGADTAVALREEEFIFFHNV